jgi:antitoxin component YwqK of YwqJK toxin-antitoxin module
MFYDNGKKHAAGKYVNGMRDGPFVWWFEWGGRSEESNYINGILNGLYQQWYYTGDIAKYGVYKDGQKDGEWEEFKPPKPRRMRLQTYEMGELINEIVIGKK